MIKNDWAIRFVANYINFRGHIFLVKQSNVMECSVLSSQRQMSIIASKQISNLKKNTWHWTVTNNINILTRWLYVLRLIAVTLLHHEFSIQVKIQLLLLYESKISNGVIHQSASHNQHLTLHDYGEWMHQQWNAFVASHDRNCARYIWSNERDPCCHVAMNPWIMCAVTCFIWSVSTQCLLL